MKDSATGARCRYANPSAMDYIHQAKQFELSRRVTASAGADIANDRYGRL